MTVLFLQITNKHKSRQRLILRKVILDVNYPYSNSMKSDATDQHPLSRDPCSCWTLSTRVRPFSNILSGISPNVDMIHSSIATHKALVGPQKG